ncbi:MAG: hypothetical protein IIA44_08565 [Acidobacteria bacterium]|nr:hypothetical protein [Acidobacteriota bacterium]
MPHPSGRPWIIAHRGASWRAPENTLAAAKLAWQEGADAVEADATLDGRSREVALQLVLREAVRRRIEAGDAR